MRRNEKGGDERREKKKYPNFVRLNYGEMQKKEMLTIKMGDGNKKRGRRGFRERTPVDWNGGKKKYAFFYGSKRHYSLLGWGGRISASRQGMSRGAALGKEKFSVLWG